MKRAVAAISLANLFFLDEWDRLISRWSDAALASPPNPSFALVFGPILLAILAVAILFWFAVPRRWLIVILLLAPFNLFRMFGLHLERQDVGRFGILALFAVAIAIMIWQYRRVAAIPLLLAPLLPIQLAFNFWRYEHLPPPSAYQDQSNAPLLPANPNAVRIVWIIFDELDQSLVFDHRPASVQLPEFDRLRRESDYADHVEAPGLYTLEAIPALLSGIHVDHSRALGPNDLALNWSAWPPPRQEDESPERPDIYDRILRGRDHIRSLLNRDRIVSLLRRDRKGVRWSTFRNIFDNLRATGFNSAILGSELPYCRAIGHSVASCDWFPSGTVDVALNRPSILDRAWYLLRTRPFTFPGLSSTRFYRAPLFDETTRRASRQAEAASFDRMGARAKELAADTRYDLVYLHFPIPHLLGFYDRRRGAYTTEDSASYLDNLALADRTLGEIRAALPAHTDLIVTSDHPLRDWIIEDASWWNDPETASLGPVPRRYVPLLMWMPKMHPEAFHDETPAFRLGESLLRMLEVRDR